MNRLKVAFSNNGETAKIYSQIQQDNDIFPTSSQTDVFNVQFSFLFWPFSQRHSNIARKRSAPTLSKKKKAAESTASPSKNAWHAKALRKHCVERYTLSPQWLILLLAMNTKTMKKSCLRCSFYSKKLAMRSLNTIESQNIIVKKYHEHVAKTSWKCRESTRKKARGRVWGGSYIQLPDARM